MSIHIGAKKGEIAEKVLLPGDPYRAKYIAENFLENAKLHNEVRGMLGFTGTYKGVPVSVQGTGMGIPSAAIYITELITEYGCNELIRIGTCGSFSEKVKVLDLVLAQATCTDSAFNDEVFGNKQFSPIADFELLYKAYNLSQTEREMKADCHVGNVVTSDKFYHDEGFENHWKLWARYGVLAVEMETAALYSIAAREDVKALSIFSVSDHFLTGEIISSEKRQLALNDMILLGLDTLVE